MDKRLSKAQFDAICSESLISYDALSRFLLGFKVKNVTRLRVERAAKKLGLTALLQCRQAV